MKIYSLQILLRLFNKIKEKNKLPVWSHLNNL